jgi:hypothetical protein
LAEDVEGSDTAWHVSMRTMLWAQQVLHYFGGAG